MTDLLTVTDLKVHFQVKRRGLLKAVDGVSFRLAQGGSLGIVGESGCGKTTTALALVGLAKPTSGEILMEGQPATPARSDRMAAARRIQLVFQDPNTSLNPRMTVGAAIGDPIVLHGLASRREAETIVARLLEQVGLKPEHALRYPHEFSGGQRQRIGIARALALRPKVIVGDELVSALDVSVQAQILNLLVELQTSLGLAMILITHNLAVVEHLCDEILVMYLGRVVEQGGFADITARPGHPYTQALVAAAPGAVVRADAAPPMEGDPPSPLNPPSGCPFHPRCPAATTICAETMPPLRLRTATHAIACHHV